MDYPNAGSSYADSSRAGALNLFGGNLPKKRNAALQAYGGSQAGRLGEQEQATGGFQDLLMQSLRDPASAGNAFLPFFQSAAQGITAPAMRDFAQQLARTQGGAASRFGGQASSEEQRGVYNTSDLFSRNLSESLARLAPEAAQMGLQSTGQRLGAYQTSLGAEQGFGGQLLSSITNRTEQPSLFGQIAGTALGVGANLAAPGLGTLFKKKPKSADSSYDTRVPYGAG